MTLGAQRDEVVRLVISTFSARDDMVNLKILRAVAECAAVAVAAVDCFAERGIDVR